VTTTIVTQTVTCRACGTTSEQEKLVDTITLGWPDLDLRPPEMRRSTMRMWLQDCPSCGFVAADLSMASDAELGALKGAGWKEAVANRDGPDALAKRFERRAFIDGQLSRQGLAAFRMLCAAWDADDRGDAGGSKGYREQAAAFFAAALENDPDAKEATDWTIQLVDILRRIGRFDEAEEYADRLIGNAAPKIDAIGRFQLRMTVEADSNRYTMGDALEDDEDG
jgi:tetratricopeptide (TPR) repeat protein